MTVHVVIPWRPQESRLPLFNAVTDWLQRDFPDWPIHLADVPTELYCLAGSRNAGVIEAQEAGASIVVLLDADTLVQSEVLQQAVDLVARQGGQAIPYSRYWMVDKAGGEQFLAGTPLTQCHAIHYPPSVSGAAVATPESWFAVGGQDERFLGWGGEDNAWYYAATTLGEVVRLEGDAFAGWHVPQVKGRVQYRRNHRLYSSYRQYAGDRRSMETLVRDPERYCVTGGPPAYREALA